MPTSDSDIVPLSNLPPSLRPPSADTNSDVVPSENLPPELKNAPVAVTPGEKEFASDRALLDKSQGVVPETLKAGAYSAGNALLLNAVTPAVAGYTALSENKPFSQAFQEQKQYEEALSRQHPTASMVGTGAGLGAGLLVGTGELGLAAEGAGTAARAATASRLGEGLLSQTAGKAAELGTAGATSGAIAGTAGYLGTMDPSQALHDAAIGAGLGAAGQAVLPALTSYFTKNPQVLDASGNLTPEASNAISRAFDGRMSPADIASFKDKITENMQKAGPTEAAARQAVLESQGVTPTRSMVTGEKPPTSAADISEAANIAAEDKLRAQAQKFAGAPSTSTDVGEALHQAERDAHLAAQDQYEQAFSGKGKFDSDIYDNVVPTIQKQLRSDKVPDLKQGDIYTQSQNAMDYLEKGIGAGNMPFPNQPNNMMNIEQVRKQLNSYWAQAKGADRVAMNSIIDGYDKTIVNAVNNGLFSGDGRQMLSDMQQARDLWSTYKTNFYSPSGGGAQPFNSAIKKMADQASGKISDDLTTGSAEAATGILNSGLMNPNMGLGVYQRLEKVFGPNSQQMDLVNQQIRNRVFNTAGDLTQLPKSIDSFLSENPSVAAKAFSPDELAQMRRLSESIKIINQRQVPAQQKDSMILNAVKDIGNTIAAGIAYNLHGAKFAGATYLGAKTLASGYQAGKGVLERMAERSGAPTGKVPSALQVFDQNSSVGALPLNLQAMSSTPEEPEYQAPTPLRPGRKDGGRIGNKIITAVERAKRNVNNTTEPLLNADDNHIAHALEIANQRTGD